MKPSFLQTGYLDDQGRPVGFGQKTLSIFWNIEREGTKAYLASPHVIYWGGYEFKILSGFKFDGASIPRAAWRLVGHPWGRYAPAALLHDILYDSEYLSREEADKALRDLIKALPVPGWKRRIIYRSVRMGGGFTWKKHTDASKKLAMSYLRIKKL